ncbi:acid ceramidase-like [Haliotis rufescens]|uniref:acid ceramidase-like n=1 Tax=Haliotis rufescens TaxID=6454 RepID=UPI001EAF9F61|nr:acid ceramidase-like [Haliotis rufescens]
MRDKPGSRGSVHMLSCDACDSDASALVGCHCTSLRPEERMLWTVVALMGCAVISVAQIPKYNESCVRGTYPPSPEKKVKTYVVNLDLPPEQRWTHVVEDKAVQIRNILAEFKKYALDWSPKAQGVIDWVDKNFPTLDKTLPYPFPGEMTGISKASGLKLGEVVLYNLFYEFFTVCTSIVAEDPTGKLFHARNLDFGLFLGWDIKNNTWDISEFLRPLIVNIEYTRGGKTLFKGVHFAGYVGILTAVKPTLFTLSMDERFNADGGFIGIMEWVLGDHSGSWMGFLTRRVMENATSYEEARDWLTQTEMLAPAYFILGGNQSGEACVITRAREKTLDVWPMASAGGWYILETNYDHWEKPMVLDDRRTPANKCMHKLTKQNVSVSGLFDVLSSIPVLNKLTTYTALMQVDSGHLETWIQYCKDPCFPW